MKANPAVMMHLMHHRMVPNILCYPGIVLLLFVLAWTERKAHIARIRYSGGMTMSGDDVPDVVPLGLNKPAVGKVRDIAVGKQCVFCGLRPSTRSKEHVLPLWLIQMTGDPKRTARFLLWNAHREFAFDQFTARACDECNNIWSRLESRAKPLVERLITGSPVLSQQEAELLLDWFDKVRLGMWLAGLALGQNPFHVAPKYHVADRVAAKDRLLYIAKSAEPSQRLTFGDISHPAFQHFPSVFRLWINGVAFLSASAIGIAAGPLGLPHLVPKRQVSADHVECALVSGRTNWFAAPAPFGVLAQAFWGPEVLSENDVTAERSRLYPDLLRSRVHILIEGVTRTLSDQPEDVCPRPTLGRDNLHERLADLELRVRHQLVRRESRAMKLHTNPVWRFLKHITAQEEHSAQNNAWKRRSGT